MALTALERIQEIQAKADQEIKELKQQAVSEVVRRLADAKQLVKDLEAEYIALTGKNLKGETATSKNFVSPKNAFTTVERLKNVISTVSAKKLNRKGFSEAGYSLKSALAVAKDAPTIFGYEQNGAQGAVWLK